MIGSGTGFASLFIGIQSAEALGRGYVSTSRGSGLPGKKLLKK